MKFDKAFQIVLGFEGGYSNDPHDSGGETNFGITASTLESAKKNGWVPKNITIKNISLSHAKTIYKNGYWDVIKADCMPEPLDLIMFDAAVNHGPANADKLLQKALNSTMANTDLAVDGIIGPIALRAVRDIQELGSTPGLKGNSTIRYLCLNVLLNRVELYTSIVANNKSQEKFFKGWITNRVINLAKKAGLL